MIHHYNCLVFIILVLFTVPFYHVLFLRYLVLPERHFLSDNLVPFPDLSNLYNHGRFICQECLDGYCSDAHDAHSFYSVISPPKYDFNITSHAEMP